MTELVVALKRAVLSLDVVVSVKSLLGAGVLGDGFGSLGDGVLGQLTGQKKTYGGLDLPTGDGGPLVVVGQTRGLGGDTLEDVVDERVHDAHRLGGDTGVGMDLLQHLVDVDGVTLLPAVLLLLVGLGDVLLGLTGFLHRFTTGLACCHDDVCRVSRFRMMIFFFFFPPNTSTKHNTTHNQSQDFE